MRCTATAPSTTCTVTPCRETQSRASSWTRRGVRRGVFQSAPSAVRVGSDRASRLQGPRCRAMEPDDGFGEGASPSRDARQGCSTDGFRDSHTQHPPNQDLQIATQPVFQHVFWGGEIADDDDDATAAKADPTYASRVLCGTRRCAHTHACCPPQGTDSFPVTTNGLFVRTKRTG